MSDSVNIPICTVKTPGICAEQELDDFVAFVRAGGEVASKDLPKRVRRAYALAFLRNGDCLIGVAGLKLPFPNYRNKVSIGSGFDLSTQDFPLELGWVFVLPSARGGRKSRPLCEPLIEAADGRGIFATSHVEKGAMHATLKNLGFSRQGGEWPSSQSPGNLWLFVKRVV